MLNLPTAPYSQMPACEHVQLKEPRLASQVQPIGKLGASTDRRDSAEKQLTALEILEKSARQTLLKSRLYKELHRVAYTFQTEKSVPLTGDHQGGKPGQNTPRHTTVILLISEDPGEASLRDEDETHTARLQSPPYSRTCRAGSKPTPTSSCPPVNTETQIQKYFHSTLTTVKGTHRSQWNLIKQRNFPPEVISLTYLGSSQKMHVDSNCPKPSASLAPLPCGLPSIRSLRRAPGTVQEREERGGLTRRRAPNRKIDSVPPGGSADLGPRAPRTLGLGVSTSHCRKLLACYRFSVTRKCFSKTSSYNQVYEILLIPNLISGVRSSCCHGDGQASPRPLMRPPGPGHSGRSGQLRGRLTCLVLSPRKPVQATLMFIYETSIHHDFVKHQTLHEARNLDESTDGPLLSGCSSSDSHTC
ncbi:hypothetical protein MG293_007998 [Ovis ammon polii]|uniref:Uncharacterized protein n=1 Tax=Ovis ammon polii TaxID=230172 RepID=A0AAD4YCB4_OVIAM|nr:hypothetical protein MG293_007998 [Ovis ammon polii]